MTSFTIDDVRDTMPMEVTTFLAELEESARVLLVQTPLSPTDGWQPIRTLSKTIAARSHAISGTSLLVSANALASCSRSIEDLAARADLELRESEARAERARRAIALIPTGVAHMRDILTLELEHREDEAQWAATEWQCSVEVLLSELAAATGAVAKQRPYGYTSIPPCLGEGDVDSRQEPEAHIIEDFTGERGPIDEPHSTRASRDHGLEHGIGAWRCLDEKPIDPTDEWSFDDSDVPNEPNPPQQLSTAHTSPLADENRGQQPTATLAVSPDNGEREAVESEEDEFSFADPQLAAEAGTHAEVLNELQAIFQQEVRESIVALQGHLAALAADPKNGHLAVPLERIYHTLKGASATVGLRAVSTRAAALQERCESFTVSGAVHPELDALVRDTNEMLSLAGLDGVRLATPAERALAAGIPPVDKLSPEEQIVRLAFLTEAEQLHQQASLLVDALSRAPTSESAGTFLHRLSALAHRLRGSALVAADDDVARLAGSLELASSSESIPTTADLSLGLAKIAARLGFGRAHLAPSALDDPKLVAATRSAYEAEARLIVDEALAHIQAPATTDGVLQQSAGEAIGLLLHRLQGSARIVGDDATAQEARSLEDLLHKAPRNTELLPTGFNERILELHSRFSSLSSHVSSPSEALCAFAPRKERVELTAPAELWETFALECAELLETLEHTTLALEDSASPKESLRSLMRLVHTLKGVVNTTGIAPTGRTLHRIEDFLEVLMNAPILPPMRAITSILLAVQVQVRRNLKEASSGWVETFPEQLERRIGAALVAQQERVGTGLRRGETATGATASERHDLSSVRSSQASVASETQDRRVIRVSTDRLDVLMNLAGELVVNRSRLNSRVERLQSIQAELVRGSGRLLESVDRFRDDNDFANLDGRRAMALTRIGSLPGNGVQREAPPAWGGFGELELDRYESIHILTRRLAELTNDFTELQSLLSKGLAALTDDSDVVGGIVTGIQTEVTRARMVPLEMLFLRLRLPLRDAAEREQKEVRDIVQGEHVPVDKTIADALFQPMLHLVRNAAVHGIERPAHRTSLGKDRVGTVELTARQESGQIVIEVRDDGAGLDLDSLRARGIAMGVLPPDTEMDDPRVKEMVFVSGLSTRPIAGDVAGRGVGCDIVKRTVDRLNGSVRIESTRGIGTLFAIRLPLTLAITRALVVRRGNQSFAIPLHFAERILDIHDQEVVATGDLLRVKMDGALLPIRHLGAFMGASLESSEGPVLMLRVGDKRMALQVDSIVAHEDIVVKTLGNILTGHPVFAGISIRGNGELVLIVDVPSVMEVRGTSVHNRDLEQSARMDGGTPEADDVQPQHAGIASPPARRRTARVLFVDDSLSVRKVAELQLKELGAEVTVAVDGVDAMSKLRELAFDIVFTDLEMPRMHGYELIRELRFLPAFKDLPIIVVSSRSGQKHRDQAHQLGANEYLTKPFTVQVLDAMIKKWFYGADNTHCLTTEEDP
jgi:chemotaxis protein histidine kinase CheA/ActR/RegA family two-component response regulator